MRGSIENNISRPVTQSYVTCIKSLCDARQIRLNIESSSSHTPLTSLDIQISMDAQPMSHQSDGDTCELIFY